jgi:hypothetical protein
MSAFSNTCSLIKLASENKNVEIETLLLRANMARNSLQMWNGFSSQQLVFGKNPHPEIPLFHVPTNAPSLLVCKIPCQHFRILVLQLLLLNVMHAVSFRALLQIKKHENIQYKLPDSEEWISATVLGKPGKMTGKNKTWYNVQDHLSDEQKSVDLGRLEWNGIENLHRDEEVHTTDNVDDTSCEIAKQLELQKLCHFDTYEEVEDCGQKTISPF